MVGIAETFARRRRWARPRVWLVAALAVLGPIGGGGAAATTVDGDTGSIRGSVEVGSELDDRRMRFTLYPDLRRERATRLDEEMIDERRNVVLYLENAPLPADWTPGTHVMRQQRSAFVPHVLPVVKGSSVAFPNFDPMFHNVFSLSKSATFDLGRYRRGQEKTVTFERPGIVKVFCHIHSDMSGVVVVLDNPYFAQPEADGSYRIDRIPPGQYRIVAWHERAKRAYGSVTVRAGQTAVVDFAIPLVESRSGGP